MQHQPESFRKKYKLKKYRLISPTIVTLGRKFKLWLDNLKNPEKIPFRTVDSRTEQQSGHDSCTD